MIDLASSGRRGCEQSGTKKEKQILSRLESEKNIAKGFMNADLLHFLPNLAYGFCAILFGEVLPTKRQRGS